MDDQLSDYKKIHQERYNAREAKRQGFVQCYKSIKDQVDIASACGVLCNVVEYMKDEEVGKGTPDIGMELLQSLNDNACLRVSLMDVNGRNNADELHRFLKEALELCGCDPDIKLEFDMDCSRDEELARALADEVEEEAPPPPPPARRQRKPRKPRAAPRTSTGS
jgi:hypothetical protein